MKFILSLCAGLTVLAATALAGASAQIEWPDGKRAAIALTYDDSLDSHLDTALPQLNERGLRGTFFLSIGRAAFPTRPGEWVEASNAGHELANHTLFHPCRGGPGRDWVEPHHDLNAYSLERFVEEVALTNEILAMVDGDRPRTFAYTCGDTTVGIDAAEADFIEAIEPLVIAARTTELAVAGVDGAKIDPMRVPTYGLSEVSGAELIAYGEQTLAAGGLGTYLFHGVGGDYLPVSAEAHEELLDWLVAHQEEIWVAPFVEIMAYVNEVQGE